MDQTGTPEQIIERRRFLLIDAITLVAAVAAMLSAGRAVDWLCRCDGPIGLYSRSHLRDLSGTLALVVLSLTLLPSQLVRPADRRRLRRGAPGLWVHVVVATVLVLWLVKLVSGAIWDKIHAFPMQWASAAIGYLFYGARPDIANGVAASWLMLVVVGLWRPERAWDDRLGRCIGALWLISSLVDRWLKALP